MQPDATAFPWRDANWIVHITCSYTLGDEAHKAQLRAFQDSVLAQLGDTCAHAYLNFQDPDREDWMEAYYGPHQRRLLEVCWSWGWG